MDLFVRSLFLTFFKERGRATRTMIEKHEQHCFQVMRPQNLPKSIRAGNLNKDLLLPNRQADELQVLQASQVGFTFDET